MGGGEAAREGSGGPAAGLGAGGLAYTLGAGGRTGRGGPVCCGSSSAGSAALGGSAGLGAVSPFGLVPAGGGGRTGREEGPLGSSAAAGSAALGAALGANCEGRGNLFSSVSPFACGSGLVSILDSNLGAGFGTKGRGGLRSDSSGAGGSTFGSGFGSGLASAFIGGGLIGRKGFFSSGSALGGSGFGAAGFAIGRTGLWSGSGSGSAAGAGGAGLGANFPTGRRGLRSDPEFSRTNSEGGALNTALGGRWGLLSSFCSSRFCWESTLVNTAGGFLGASSSCESAGLGGRKGLGGPADSSGCAAGWAAVLN